MAPRVDPFGPNALLIRFADPGDEAAFGRTQFLLRHLDHHPPVGLVEATPGIRSLLLEFEPGTRPGAEAFAAILNGVLRPAPAVHTPSRVVEIPTVYDGPDLEQVAAHAGMTLDDVIRCHTAVTYRVQLLGFAPGFPYLSGLDPRLHVPRRATPRPHVPVGSVAIGGEHTGIYPMSTAGGWNLIGRTAVPLMNPGLAAHGQVEAFLLRPGDGVRFQSLPPEALGPGVPAPAPRRSNPDPTSGGTCS